MKKWIIVLFSVLLVIGLGLFLTNTKEPLPLTTLPLDTDTIGRTLEQLDLSYSLKEDTKMPHPDRSRISLYNHDNENFFVYGITSGVKNNERLVLVTLVPHNAPTALSEEDWKDSILLATMLYGGFESKTYIYDSFISEYTQGDSNWQLHVDGTTCEIEFRQPISGDPQSYLTTIAITSDMNTFFPKRNK